MNFNWPIVGHKNIIEFLQRSMENNKLSHAYLFVGEKKIGKKTIADLFSQSLLCTSDNQKPCNVCQQCRQFINGTHNDLYRLQKNNDEKNIGIEKIREIISKLSLKSFLAGYKIAIIENAEYLSEEAANALLKTLEEPTGNTIIILLAEAQEYIPQTIISRCQIIRFQRLNYKIIKEYLINKKNIDNQEADKMARMSGGLYGLVNEWLLDKTEWDKYILAIQEKLNILENPLYENFLIVNDKFSTRMSFNKKIYIVRKELDLWTVIFRDLLLIKTKNTDLLINFFLKKQMEKLAEKFDKNKLQKIINLIIDLKKKTNLNINPALLMENLYINFNN